MFFFGWRKELKDIKTHIAKINDELGDMQDDMKWVKWGVRAILLAAVVDVVKDWLS